MARYIDRDLILKDIRESVVFTVRNAEISPELRGARKIIDRIKNAPTVDVVEVVRCKDCGMKGAAFCMAGDLPLTKENENDFCSYGERRDT